MRILSPYGVPAARFAGRRFTRDGLMTYDSHRTVDENGNQMGKRLPHPVQFKDASGRVRTADSTGAFLVGELERLDQKLHDPLVSVTWSRDIDLREDVTIADEFSSFTLSQFASPGGLGTGQGIGSGKAWIGKDSNEIARLSLDIGKTANPLRLWGLELAYTIPELESAAKAGRPVDQQKYQGLQLKHQMDIDEQVYIGDTVTGDKGLVNNTSVTATNVPNGALGSPLWVNKTPDEILLDFNSLLTSTWAASGYALIPGSVLLPPTQYGYISTAKVSLAGNMSIKKYIEENNLFSTHGGGKLRIEPLKWLVGAGVGGTIGTANTMDRMVAYTKDHDRVRYPMTRLQRTPLQYDGIWHKCTYFGRLGVVEAVYTETLGYADGL